MTLGPDASCELLTWRLLGKEPFIFTKLGDAEIEWIFRIGACEAEGEIGTPEHGEALKLGWVQMGESPRLYVGDWLTATFDSSSNGTRYPDYYEKLLAMLANKPTMLAYESLLMMRKTPELLRFWMTLKRDPRRKVFVGPERLAPAARALGCQHVIVPLEGASASWLHIRQGIPDPFSICLFASGRSAKMIMGDIARYSAQFTLIDIGSALDPLFIGQTRSQQIPKDQAEFYFAEVLR